MIRRMPSPAFELALYSGRRNRSWWRRGELNTAFVRIIVYFVVAASKRTPFRLPPIAVSSPCNTRLPIHAYTGEARGRSALPGVL